MSTFMTLLLACSASMSIVSLIWMGLLPGLSKRYEAKWLYAICLLLMAGWIIPVRPIVDLSFMAAPLPAHPLVPALSELPNASQTLRVLPAEVELAGHSITTSSVLLWGILAIWLAGMCAYLAIHVLRHWRLTQTMRRWSEPVTEASVLGIAKRLKQEMNIHQSVELKVWPGVSSPMLMGLRKPVIVLPSADIADDELVLILKHEFIHYQRRDLWFKAVVLLATALHWFNPVVYLMARTTAAQCEISCDARVLRGADFQQRKRYGETIIGMARRHAVPPIAITTLLDGGKQGMKARLFSIMDTKKKKAGVILLCVVLLAAVGTGAVFAAHSTTTSAERKQVADDGQAVSTITGTPVEGGSISSRDGQHLSVSAFRGGQYTNFAELPLQQGETFTLSVTSQDVLDLEVGLLSISTGEEYGGRVKSSTGEVSLTIPEDGEYRVYLRNHAEETAHFDLQLSKAIEGPIV